MERNLLDDLAFVNTDTLVLPVKGVVINCHGFSDLTVFKSSPRFAKDLGEKGIVYVFPYYSPWAWCSDATIEYMDRVLDAVYELLSISEDIPFVVAGGSMGGMTALMYSIYGTRRPVAVACNCPVTDMHRYASNGGVGTRSLYASIIKKGVSFDESLSKIDPMLHINDFARIPYLIVGGEKDMGISPELYQRPFVKKMKERGHDIELLVVPGMNHCCIMEHEDAYQKYLTFVAGQIEKNL